MRRLALSLLLSLPALAAPDAADSVSQAVQTYLASIDTPISAARWRALGPEASPLLASIATSDSLPSRRAKALHALSIVDPARAAPLAAADAADAQQPLVVRSAAVRAVARSLPAPQALAILRPLLNGASIPLQRRTADAMASLGPSGCTALQAHSGTLSPQAQEPFTTALAQCAGPSK